MGWEWGVETVLDRSDILKTPLSKPYMSMLCDHGLAWSRQMQGLHPDLPSHGRHSSVVLTTTFRVRWSHSALCIPHHRERMVGIHRGIMENERENLIASSRELMADYSDPHSHSLYRSLFL